MMDERNGNAGELPKAWVWASLGDVCLPPQYGWTTSAVTEGKLRLLRTTDITSGKINWSTVPFCKDAPVEEEKYLLRDGDIVISRAGSVGYSYLVKNPERAVFASYLIRFRPIIDKEYVQFFLQSPSYWRSISEESLGIAIPNVNASKLKRISIPIAPLAEQHRIVAKIEELFSDLDAGVAALQKTKAQLKRYRQAVLKAAVEGKLTAEWRAANAGKIEPASALLERIRAERAKNARRKSVGAIHELPQPDAAELGELPEGWGWTRVQEVAEKIQYGTSEKADEESSAVPVVRMGNIQEGEINFDSLKYLPENSPHLEDFVLEDGDVLFNRTNSAELVGKTAVYKRYHPRAVFASYLIRVKVSVGFYDPDILSFFINSTYGRRYISSVVSQQVGQANVNGTKLSQMPIPLAPLIEQKQIVAEVERRLSVADEAEKTVDASLKQAERLRQSILKRAFAGKLVPQDPNDEPAERLLERIKAGGKKQTPDERKSSKRSVQ